VLPSPPSAAQISSQFTTNISIFTIKLDIFVECQIVFSALMLLVGQKEEHLASKTSASKPTDI